MPAFRCNKNFANRWSYWQGQDPSPGRGRVVATNDGHRATHGQRSCRAMPPVGAGAEAPVLIQGCVASDGGYISFFSDVAPFRFPKSLTHLTYPGDRRWRAPDPISLRAGVSSLPKYYHILVLESGLRVNFLYNSHFPSLFTEQH